MGRFLTAVVALALMGWMAYSVVHKQKTEGERPGDLTRSAPKQQLDNVREAADRIEKQGAARVEDVMNRGTQLEK